MESNKKKLGEYTVIRAEEYVLFVNKLQCRFCFVDGLFKKNPWQKRKFTKKQEQHHHKRLANLCLKNCKASY